MEFNVTKLLYRYAIMEYGDMNIIVWISMIIGENVIFKSSVSMCDGTTTMIYAQDKFSDSIL